VSQHQGCLLVLSLLGPLFYISLTVIESISLFLKLGLEVEDLLVSVSLDSVKLLLQTFHSFLLFFPLLGKVGACTLGIPDCELKLFVKIGFFLIKLNNLCC
jgi:hypothetical protein